MQSSEVKKSSFLNFRMKSAKFVVLAISEKRYNSVYKSLNDLVKNKKVRKSRIYSKYFINICKTINYLIFELEKD